MTGPDAALVLQLSILTTGAVLAGRVAVKPSVRRELVTNVPAACVAVVGAVGAAALFWWAWGHPVARWVVVAVVGLGSAAAWWRGRPTYGARRGWPPGSLSLADSLDAIDERTFYEDRARELGPVFKMSQFGRPVVCI